MRWRLRGRGMGDPQGPGGPRQRAAAIRCQASRAPPPSRQARPDPRDATARQHIGYLHLRRLARPSIAWATACRPRAQPPAGRSPREVRKTCGEGCRLRAGHATPPPGAECRGRDSEALATERPATMPMRPVPIGGGAAGGGPEASLGPRVCAGGGDGPSQSNRDRGPAGKAAASETHDSAARPAEVPPKEVVSESARPARGLRRISGTNARGTRPDGPPGGHRRRNC